ncbi:MAG: leucine-rich repeat protein, partial [Prevotellaceae bacterium]|nr:leucine-rich repeat protein [Prevotellaceae bacterium]
IMRKKINFLFLALAFMALSAGVANAQNVGDVFNDGTLVYKITSLSPAEVQIGTGSGNGNGHISGTNASGTLTIPSQVTGGTGNQTYSVTSIANHVFTFCSGLTGSLTIPNSVTSIGTSAFNFCYGFTGSLTIPNSVTNIDDGTFYYCSGFTGSLTIPNSVTSIGENAFCYCSGFTGSLTIGNSVTTIGFRAFYMCSGLTGSLTIGNSVTSIGEGAFYYSRSGFTSVTSLAVNPPTLGTYAFYGVPTGIPVSVPCDAVEAYQAAEGWSDFTNYTNCLSKINDVKDNSSISIYPNPATDKATVRIDGLTTSAKVTVIDLSGRLIETRTISAGSTETEINVSAYASGVYLVRIVSDNVNKVEKLTVK